MIKIRRNCKKIERSCSELMPFHSFSPGCYARYWSTEDIHHHLGITSALEHAIPNSSEPSQAPPFVDQPMPHQEPPTGEAAEPSFPQHHSMSLRRYHFLPIFQSLLSHWGQCSAWLGGELRKEVFVNNAKLFW